VGGFLVNTQLAPRQAEVPQVLRPEEQRLGGDFAKTAKARARLRRLAFYVLVFAPTVLSGLYFGFLAAGRYVSETTFVVRGVSSSRSSGLEALFRSFGIARTVDDTNIVETYLVSRDALRDLAAALPLREMYARPEADLLSRYPHPLLGEGFEQLYDYFQSRVRVVEDSERGLAHLFVEGFRADDAQKISRQLLAQAELFVNKLNDRAQSDAVRNAQEEVERAVGKVVAAQNDLTTFRNSASLVDPQKNSVAQVDLITQLTSERDEILAQVKQSEVLNPKSPGIPSLHARADALSQRIGAETDKLAGKAESLSGKVSTYERLSTLKNLADKTLAGDVLSLESAKQEALRQQIYIEEVVSANLPDVATEPHRLRAWAQVFFVTMSLLAVAWILSVGVREHRS
jgi:capsular polysaccharide transport system permease protein